MNRHARRLWNKLQPKQQQPTILIPSKSSNIAIPEDIEMRLIAEDNFQRGMDRGLELGAKQAAVLRWLDRCDLVASQIFSIARYAKLLPHNVVKADLDGLIGELSGAFNEFLSAGRALEIEIMVRWPVLGERVQAIIEGIEAVKNGADPHATKLCGLASGTPFFEIPLELKVQIEKGGRPSIMKPERERIAVRALRRRDKGMQVSDIVTELEAELATEATTDVTSALALHLLKFTGSNRKRERSARQKENYVTKAISAYQEWRTKQGLSL